MKIIAICGAPGSGKTAICEMIKTNWREQDVSTLSFDDYYFHPDHYSINVNGIINWDTPEALDWLSIKTDLKRLIAGETIFTPYNSDLYEQEVGKRSIGRTIEPRAILIVEGMHALYDEELISMYAYKIFLSASLEKRLARRKRAIMTDAYISMIHIPMLEQFVEPASRFADVILETDDLTTTQVCELILDFLNDRDEPSHH
jgi:uridine kinase